MRAERAATRRQCSATRVGHEEARADTWDSRRLDATHSRLSSASCRLHYRPQLPTLSLSVSRARLRLRCSSRRLAAHARTRVRVYTRTRAHARTAGENASREAMHEVWVDTGSRGCLSPSSSSTPFSHSSILLFVKSTAMCIQHSRVRLVTKVNLISCFWLKRVVAAWESKNDALLAPRLSGETFLYTYDEKKTRKNEKHVDRVLDL